MKREHVCEIKEPYKLYRIGMFASMNHVTVKALRYYDEQGLLKPVCVDMATGYRYYTAGQLPVIHQILALRNMGFSLDEIREIQNGGSEAELLKAKKRQLLAEIAEKTAKLAQVECYLSSENINAKICESVTELKPDSETIRFKVIPEVETAACVLHKGPYEGFPEAYAAVIRFVEDNGYEICGSPRESYIDGVWNKEDEAEWLSEVQFPVRKINNAD